MEKEQLPIKKEMYDITSFLETYSMSRSTFYAEVKSGALRITKLRAKPYIKREDAEKWKHEIGKY